MRLIYNENKPNYNAPGITLFELAESYTDARIGGCGFSVEWAATHDACDEKNKAIKEFDDFVGLLKTGNDIEKASAMHEVGYSLAYAYQTAALIEGMRMGARLITELLEVGGK
jgi:putative heme degradation protein